MLGITGEVRAFMLDNAVFTFGAALSSELQNVEGKTKKEMERKQARILRKWLPDSSAGKPKFRDPAKKD